MTVCWAEDQSRARKTARELWPTAGLSSELTQELKLPAHFEQATTTVREEDISKTIGHVSEVSEAIAAAVTEQEAATHEIMRNVEYAEKETSNAALNISNVSRGASETGIALGQMLSSAQELSAESNRLKSEAEKFLAKVRAG